MCHAATWLINGVRDGHGSIWKLHARKATVVHPELPMVTRCHSYDIKYKFQYQCTRCKNMYVSLFNAIKLCVFFTGMNFLLLCCIFHHNSPQDWTSFQVAGHSEVCVRPLHGTAGLADALEATCIHTFCQLCERELRVCATGASRTKPCGSNA